MIILLISGYAGSGKDTFADYLVDMLETKGFYYDRFAFANKVKEEVSTIYKIPLSNFYTQTGKNSIVSTSEGDKTCRQLLIEYSAQMKLNFGNDYWAKLVCNEISTSKDFILLTDWRYNAEYDTIKSYFSDQTIITVRVFNPHVVVSDDSSEHELDSKSFDYVINNNSTKETFQIKVNSFLDIILTL
jgi:hypothetical protein